MKCFLLMTFDDLYYFILYKVVKIAVVKILQDFQCGAECFRLQIVQFFAFNNFKNVEITLNKRM